MVSPEEKVGVSIPVRSMSAKSNCYDNGVPRTLFKSRWLFALQMRQNPLDNGRIFNAGDDLDLPGAALACLYVDPNAAQLNPA